MQRSDGADRVAQQDADHSSEGGENDGLGQELGQNVAPPPADALSQPDLARPFGDRDEHDVHDSDPAHDQGDSDDAREHAAGHHLHPLKVAKELVLTKDAKIVGNTRLEVVPRTEHAGDLQRSLLGVLLPGGLYDEGHEGR